MSGATMSGMLSLQMEKPSAETVSSDLISGMDTDGDGELSAEEIKAAFSAAGIDADISGAFAEMDADGDSLISNSELTSVVSSAMAKRGPGGMGGPPPGGPPPGGPPSADEAASGLMSAFDEDEDDALSIDEIVAGLGQDTASDELKAGFASLDSDGSGSLSSSEIASAITASMEKAFAAYAKTSTMSASYA